jgi:periplasmic protein TonB
MLRVVPSWSDPLCGPSVAEGHRFTLMLAGALLVHGVVALALPRHEPLRARAPALVSEVIDITPEPPPAPDVPPVAPEPREPEPTPTLRAARRVEQPAPPREAPEVLTQAPESDAPLDLTDTIVTGVGSSVGGPSSARGAPGSGPASRNGTTGGGAATGRTGSASAGIDRSRAATLAGGLAWNCPFPDGADREGVDHALVSLQIRVDAAGVLRAVSVLEDPGFGFGAAAQRCARLQRFEPARAADGTAIPGQMTVRVRFSR